MKTFLNRCIWANFFFTTAAILIAILFWLPMERMYFQFLKSKSMRYKGTVYFIFSPSCLQEKKESRNGSLKWGIFLGGKGWVEGFLLLLHSIAFFTWEQNHTFYPKLRKCLFHINRGHYNLHVSSCTKFRTASQQ